MLVTPGIKGALARLMNYLEGEGSLIQVWIDNATYSSNYITCFKIVCRQSHFYVYCILIITATMYVKC